MGLVNYTQFSNGTIADANAVNTALSTIYNEFNGNISSANLANDSVGTNEIIDGSITSAKLSTSSGEIGGAWQTWTPTFTNLTVGNGTLSAYYARIGKLVAVTLSFTLGTTSSMGSGPNYTLPATAASRYSSGIELGPVFVEDTGTAAYIANTRTTSTTLANMEIMTASGTYVGVGGITSTAPMTWTTGDRFSFSYVYEAA